MRKNELRARSAVKRDLAAIALPTKLQLQKIISELQNLVYSALRTGETTDIEKVCQERLLALLDAGTEVAVLKGGRRGQLSSEKVIDEPISEIMPVRFSLQDKGTVQAQGTAKYLQRISGIDPTRTNNEFRKQNAVLINGLSKEICDTVRKTIVDLTKLGVHVRGGKKEISDILLNAGLDPAATPRLAETIFRTQTAAAYNAGRWNIVNDSDTAPYIWGFQYCTAHDRRVRPEHRLLEGVRLPKDDPFWKRYFPPNGWNCRCTVLEIWNDEETACEDFGITGVDPRKRSPKELNLLPAFDGNAGILGYGRGGSGGGIKDNIPASPKPSLEEAKEVRTEEKEKVEGKKEKKDQNINENNSQRAEQKYPEEKRFYYPLYDVTIIFKETEDVAFSTKIHRKVILIYEKKGDGKTGKPFGSINERKNGNFQIQIGKYRATCLSEESARATAREYIEKNILNKDKNEDENDEERLFYDVRQIIEEDENDEDEKDKDKLFTRDLLTRYQKSSKIKNIKALFGSIIPGLPKTKKGQRGALVGRNQRGLFQKKHKQEKLFIQEMLNAGIDVELFPEGKKKTPDFYLNGIVVEYKAAFSRTHENIIKNGTKGLLHQLRNQPIKYLIIDGRFAWLKKNDIAVIHKALKNTNCKKGYVIYILRSTIVRKRL